MEKLSLPSGYEGLRAYRAVSFEDLVQSRRATVQACLEYGVARKVVTDDPDVSITERKDTCMDHKSELDQGPFQVDKITVVDINNTTGPSFELELPTEEELEIIRRIHPNYNPAALKRNTWDSLLDLRAIYSCRGDHFTLGGVENPLAYK